MEEMEKCGNCKYSQEDVLLKELKQIDSDFNTENATLALMEALYNYLPLQVSSSLKATYVNINASQNGRRGMCPICNHKYHLDICNQRSSSHEDVCQCSGEDDSYDK